MSLMSLENTSHPGRPGPDELVPSRYAVRVGDIDVLVVSDGVLPLPTAMLAHNADPAVRAAWLDDMFLPQDAFDWPLNVVVVRSGGKTILIDAGLGLDPKLNLPRAGQLVKRLEAAGIDLASVTDVVLTHMHMDHIGGLLVDGVKERLRPDLRIHVAAAEVKFWESPDFSQTSMPPGFPDALRSAAKQFVNEYRSHLRPFDEEYEVAPGVVVRRTGGHTPGHSVVRLASGGDRLTFAGDAVFAVGFEQPDWHNGFEHDPEEAARVQVPSFAGAGGDRRATGRHSPAVPVRRPGGGRRRRLSLGTCLLGLLTACWFGPHYALLWHAKGASVGPLFIKSLSTKISSTGSRFCPCSAPGLPVMPVALHVATDDGSVPSPGRPSIRSKISRGDELLDAFSRRVLAGHQRLEFLDGVSSYCDISDDSNHAKTSD